MSELCEHVRGESTPQGPPLLNGRPGPLVGAGAALRMQWLCAWPASKREPDGRRVCPSHASMDADPLR